MATKDTYELQDTFAHIDETQKTLDVEKSFNLANNGKNIETFQGEGSSIEEKQAAITLYAQIYAKTFGVSIESANIIATSKVTSGTTYTNADKTRSTIDINDNAQRNATDYAKTMGHEVTHVRIAQNKTRDRENTALNEEYAESMGSYSADGMVFSANTYNYVRLDRNEDTNQHVRTKTDKAVLKKNNANWRANIERAKNGDGRIDFRQLYKQEAKLLDQAKDKIKNNPKYTEEEKNLMQLQLNAVACAEINCAEGVPEDDVHYQQLSKLQTLGNELKDKELSLEKMLGKNLPKGSFEYGFEDTVQDTITKHDSKIQRGKGLVDTGIGAVGVVVGATATVVTAPACPATVVGCVIPAATAAGTALAANQAVDGVKAMFGDYTSVEGQRVLDSFTEESHQGDRSLMKDAALNTGLWVAEAVVIKKVAKLIPDGWLGKKGGADGRDTQTNENNGIDELYGDVKNREIDLSAGCKGAWCKDLNKPKPNTDYKVDENYAFRTDSLGRTSKVEGKLDLNTKDRNTYQQCKSGHCGDSDDEGGHLIASIFNGPGEKINLVPMNGNLNKGEWKKLENKWADALKGGKSVKVTVEPVYSGKSVRPESFSIGYSIDGDRLVRKTFLNTPGGQ